MGKPITKFADGSYLEYAQGKFDQWCVYLIRPNQPKYAPQDWQYFRRLADWATKHNAQNLYNDFIEIYNQTTPDLNEVILEKIKTLSSKYVSGNDCRRTKGKHQIRETDKKARSTPSTDRQNII